MSDPRLIFTDLDGTLISHDQTIPASALNAVREAQARGHQVFICTGRSLPELYPYLYDIGFNGVITGAGAHVQVGDDLLCDLRIGAGAIQEVTHILADRDGTWIWQGPDAIHPCDTFVDYFSAADSGFAREWSIYIQLISPFFRPGLPDSSSKCTAYLPAGSARFEEIEEALPAGLTMVRGSVDNGIDLNVEITRADATKGTALRLITDHLGFDIEQTIALGDSDNDIEALKVAGVGVAMGNATPGVKAVADMVTAPITQNGFAMALRELGLVRLTPPSAAIRSGRPVAASSPISRNAPCPTSRHESE